MALVVFLVVLRSVEEGVLLEADGDLLLFLDFVVVLVGDGAGVGGSSLPHHRREDLCLPSPDFVPICFNIVSFMHPCIINMDKVIALIK